MAYSKRIISHANDLVTIAACKTLNLTHVNEYPKCGATWVSRLLRSYIGISRDYGNSRLVRPNAVIQKHRLFTPHFKKTCNCRSGSEGCVGFLFFLRGISS